MKIKTDFIFLLGIAFMPFDNLFFAPSAGWATITPLIFLLYILINSKYLLKIKFNGVIIFYLVGLLISLPNYIFVDTDFSIVIRAYISLGLGLVNYLAFYIYFVQKKRDIAIVESILIKVYYISLIFGWICFIAYKLRISPLVNFLSTLMKRDYLVAHGGRIGFTFTEPSFIGMHLFGVLLLLYIYNKNPKIKNLIIFFTISALLISTSVRFIIDVLFVVGILLISKINFKKISNIILIIVIPIILITSISLAYNNNARFKAVINNGIYADGSLASRYFRINASIKGYQRDIIHFLFGYGAGNAIIPIWEGYDAARAEYNNNYLTQVDYLGDRNYRDANVVFCLYISLISEFGFIYFALSIMGLFFLIKKANKKWLRYFIIILYLYIQWDTLSFYSIWLMIIFVQIEKSNILKDGIYSPISPELTHKIIL